jgi:hypothetical protein
MFDSECLLKATAIMLITLLIMGGFFLIFKNCQGDYCPSIAHAKMKWEAITNDK